MCCFVVRVRARNNNGWGEFSEAVHIKTENKKKRKAQVITTVKIASDREHCSDRHPNNLLFANEKMFDNSLNVQDFTLAEQNCDLQKKPRFILNDWHRLNNISNVMDWFVLDLGSVAELNVIRIKFNMQHTKLGNIPKFIICDIAKGDIDETNKVYFYKPIDSLENTENEQLLKV